MAVLGINSINTNIITDTIKSNGVTDSKLGLNNKGICKESKNSFENILDSVKDGVHKVNDTQVSANDKIESLIKGEDVSMHEVMLSVQEAQMSMQLMLEVRNKIYEAYQEVKGVQL